MMVSDRNMWFLELVYSNATVHTFITRSSLTDAYALSGVALYLERMSREDEEEVYCADTFFHALWLVFAMDEDALDGQQEVLVQVAGRHKWVHEHSLRKATPAYVAAYARHRFGYLTKTSRFHTAFASFFVTALGCRGFLPPSLVAAKARDLSRASGFVGSQTRVISVCTGGPQEADLLREEVALGAPFARGERV